MYKRQILHYTIALFLLIIMIIMIIMIITWYYLVVYIIILIFLVYFPSDNLTSNLSKTWTNATAAGHLANHPSAQNTKKKKPYSYLQHGCYSSNKCFVHAVERARFLKRAPRAYYGAI